MDQDTVLGQKIQALLSQKPCQITLCIDQSRSISKLRGDGRKSGMSLQQGLSCHMSIQCQAQLGAMFIIAIIIIGP
ncbi:hypothetical protein Y1Q_0010982 [Alligator mississippiensis]|uniref:Uncharacterized protein n=1 Tax=Alligator mississippiensis TaxID=8496 RepID=A0A151NLB1_ALLMI|nr:hypothetical protein Y1Q_0010982 [Alligator mississippiensis]